MTKGSFIISLDFELHWGGVELWDLSRKKEYFLTTRVALPKILELFENFNIRGTWATVGFLFAKDLADLKLSLPIIRPTYYNDALNYYSLIENGKIGKDEQDDPYHFGYSLVQKIHDSKNQEIASHTFCHYYCNEDGQTVQQFEADIYAAQKIAHANFNIELQSLVFPRNQFNKEYLEVAKKSGIKVFRSNPNVWFWKYKFGKLTSILRGLDTLLPISRSLTFKESEVIVRDGIVELPASRFFRPFVHTEKVIRKIKLNRVLNEMTYAAKNNEIYHLWWHPHNFGDALSENLEDITIILTHYEVLHLKYGFLSQSMSDFIR